MGLSRWNGYYYTKICRWRCVLFFVRSKIEDRSVSERCCAVERARGMRAKGWKGATPEPPHPGRLRLNPPKFPHPHHTDYWSTYHPHQRQIPTQYSHVYLVSRISQHYGKCLRPISVIFKFTPINITLYFHCTYLTHWKHEYIVN